MELSIFLAKLFGLYMLVIAVLWLWRGEVLSGVIEGFFASREMLFLSGLIALVVGLAMVIGHSYWEPNWRGVITLFGYLSVAKGVARIGFPDVPRKMVGSLLHGQARWFLIGLSFVLGGYLSWAGFTQ